jgi:hypothetical protein
MLWESVGKKYAYLVEQWETCRRFACIFTNMSAAPKSPLGLIGGFTDVSSKCEPEATYKMLSRVKY